MFCHVKTKPFVMLTDGNEFPASEWILFSFLISVLRIGKDPFPTKC